MRLPLPDSMNLKWIIRTHVEAVVTVYKGNVSAASRALGVSRATVERMRKRWAAADRKAEKRRR